MLPALTALLAPLWDDPARFSLAAILAIPPLGPLLFVLINALSWTRGRPLPAPAGLGPVSVLIPARDEVANIERCVRAVDAAEGPIAEIIVYDDGSTDGTSEVLARLQAELPRLRVLRGAGLPPGWVGKVHACHQLTAHATAPLLLHLDADVSLAPDGLLRMLSLLATPAQGPAGLSAALVTAVPRQRTGSLAERLMMPLLHLSYAAWLPLQLIHLVSDPRVLAANGQLLLVRRGALDAVGGWARVRAAVVDDMALCRAVKESGQRVVFADGDQMATCRMYEDAGALWRGFSKNFYEGIGGRPFALILVIALHIGLFVLPYGGLAVAWAGGAPDLALAAGVGVAANVLLRAVLALRHHHGPLSVALHPIAVLGMMAVLLNSAWWSRKGAIQWRGRSYAARAAREAA